LGFPSFARTQFGSFDIPRRLLPTRREFDLPFRLSSRFAHFEIGFVSHFEACLSAGECL